MKIKIQSDGFTLRQQLTELVQKKVQKFSRLCSDLISIDVKFKLNKTGNKIKKRCGMRLVIPGHDMICNTQSNSFEEAVAIAVEALERQVEKRKKKTRKLVLVQSSNTAQLVLTANPLIQPIF
jgi:ribosomal subunit interface protein